LSAFTPQSNKHRPNKHFQRFSTLLILSFLTISSAAIAQSFQAYRGTPAPVPGTIQAEDFDTGGLHIGYITSDNTNHGGEYRPDEGVSIEKSTDFGEGYDVSWTKAGDILNYRVNVAADGTYPLKVRVASPLGGGWFHLGVDGKNATGGIMVPSTGGGQTWTTLKTNITVTKGSHLLQLQMDLNGWDGTVGNFNWIQIGTRLVGYLTDRISFANYAKTADFSKMTHLNLILAATPPCDGTCTQNSDMHFSFTHPQSDEDIKALVDAAHAAGVKVLVTIGGDEITKTWIAPFYKAGLSTQLVDSIAHFVDDHNLDGVDVDVEPAPELGDPYATFMTALVKKLRPKGNLITAALQEGADLPTSIYHQLDFDNVMAYTGYSGSKSRLDYYSGKSIPIDQLVLGVPFAGNDAHWLQNPSYSGILAEYPDAWNRDTVSGGSAFGGQTIHYVGEVTMAEETLLGAQYGGIMIFPLETDAPAPHSLLKIIQNNLYRNWWDCLFMDCSKQ